MALTLARATFLLGYFALACTTEDVDPGQQMHPPNPSPTASNTSDPAPTSTWLPRANPELLPASGPYRWKNVVVLGGGFVSGVVFGPTGTPYARTDVGGAYRFESGATGASDG